MDEVAMNRDGCQAKIESGLERIEKHVSELHSVVRGGGASVPADLYMKICESMRELEDAVMVLRRSVSP